MCTSLLYYRDCIDSQAQHPNGIEDEREKSEPKLRVKFCVCVCVCVQTDFLFRQVVMWENNTGFEVSRGVP